MKVAVNVAVNVKAKSQSKLKLNIVLFFVLQIYSCFGLSVSRGVEQLVSFETEANAAALRSPEVVSIPHYEIPIRLVKYDFSLRMDPLISSSLVFEKDGETYVRWILNPDDTRWYKDVEAFLTKNSIDATKHFYFLAFRTASRSYIVEDPSNGAQFSVKASTNVTGGKWTDKKQPIGEAYDSRIMSDFLIEQGRRRPFEHFAIMEEPAILAIDELDQAVVIRDLGPLKESGGDLFYVPGFSVLHEKVGREIAALNGSEDPYEFWTENYVVLAGKALGELAARTGVQFDSPHSQNFLVELDSNMKPTGKLILRDMADLYIDKNFIQQLLPKSEASALLANFSQKSNVLPAISAGFGPLHGNNSPTWITADDYAKWNRVFAKAFEETVEDVTGVSRPNFKSEFMQVGKYFVNSYNFVANPAFAEFFEVMKLKGVATFVETDLNLSCRLLMARPTMKAAQ